MTSRPPITRRLVSLNRDTHQLVVCVELTDWCSATENPKYEPDSPNFMTGILGSRLKLAALCKMHKNKTPPHTTLRAIVYDVRCLFRRLNREFALYHLFQVILTHRDFRGSGWRGECDRPPARSPFAGRVWVSAKVYFHSHHTATTCTAHTRTTWKATELIKLPQPCSDI